MRRCDSLPPVSPRFVSFAWRYPRFRPILRPPQPRTQAGDQPGVGQPGLRPACNGGGGRVSQVPGDPSCALALFFDPGGIGHTRPSRRANTVPAADKSEDSHEELSRLNRTAWALAVYASQGGSPLHHARLASGCWPGSTGRDWLPAGFPTKGFKFVAILLS